MKEFFSTQFKIHFSDAIKCRFNIKKNSLSITRVDKVKSKDEIEQAKYFTINKLTCYQQYKLLITCELKLIF